MFPEESLQLPVIKEGDADDTHYADVFDSKQKGLRYFRKLMESYDDDETAIKAFLQAYLASVMAADGRFAQNDGDTYATTTAWRSCTTMMPTPTNGRT